MVTIVVYLVLLILLTPPLGAYMYRVYTREQIGRAEGLVYRLIGVDPRSEQSWRDTRRRACWFSVFSMSCCTSCSGSRAPPAEPRRAARGGPVRLVQHRRPAS